MGSLIGDFCGVLGLTATKDIRFLTKISAYLDSFKNLL